MLLERVFSRQVAVFVSAGLAAIVLLNLVLLLPLARAFDERNLLLINVVWPVFQAGRRAHLAGESVPSAILQAIAGGLMMQKGMSMAVRSQHASGWSAWRSKFLVNAGASMIESAGTDRFTFRMDVGPVWVIADSTSLRFRPGLHSVVAPLVNIAEGSKPDWKNSLKYGTMAFTRPQNNDGTIGSNGALAYSNANNFITNPTGAHAGHEFLHTLQYRRDAALSPRLGRLIPEIDRRIGSAWVDDTGWFVNWTAQLIWAELFNKSKDFDIPMEKEAYYYELKYLKAL